jgi:hypothetical protein
MLSKALFTSQTDLSNLTAWVQQGDLMSLIVDALNSTDDALIAAGIKLAASTFKYQSALVCIYPFFSDIFLQKIK